MRRALRLRTRADFQHVRRVGRSVANPLLVLNYAPGAAATSRFGFIVGKKVGGAVVRNRVKRRLRERMRLYVMNQRLREPFDIVLIARAGAGTASATEMQRALDELLTRARLWQTE